METEPTLTAMRAAADALRDAYGAPDDPHALHARIGELHVLLTRLRQVAQILSERAGALDWDSPPGVFSDNATPPARHAERAMLDLADAAAAVREADDLVNAAWSSIGHLGITDGSVPPA